MATDNSITLNKRMTVSVATLLVVAPAMFSAVVWYSGINTRVEALEKNNDTLLSKIDALNNNLVTTNQNVVILQTRIDALLQQ